MHGMALDCSEVGKDMIAEAFGADLLMPSPEDPLVTITTGQFFWSLPGRAGRAWTNGGFACGAEVLSRAEGVG